VFTDVGVVVHHDGTRYSERPWTSPRQTPRPAPLSEARAAAAEPVDPVSPLSRLARSTGSRGQLDLGQSRRRARRACRSSKPSPPDFRVWAEERVSRGKPDPELFPRRDSTGADPAINEGLTLKCESPAIVRACCRYRRLVRAAARSARCVAHDRSVLKGVQPSRPGWPSATPRTS
jgi:hypothetical protein